ncbi:LexA family protein [Agathobacter rectalis]|jgi:repressor LexA|uniref:LexA family protein n=1 Tax=Agathobacter rectalis TaxID=39491 RepID=UPI00269A023A|nr:S24 family peptidase [Agathobacter rectalis]
MRHKSTELMGTIKAFVDKENQKIRLHPENKTMKDIIVSDCKIQGVAVKVIKNLE